MSIECSLVKCRWHKNYEDKENTSHCTQDECTMYYYEDNPIGKIIGVVGVLDKYHEKDFLKLEKAVFKIFKLGDRFVSGGSHIGAERFIEEIARDRFIPITIHFPQRARKRSFLIAKLLRNIEIANDAKVLIAVINKDRTGDVENIIDKFLIKINKTEEQAKKDGDLILIK